MNKSLKLLEKQDARVLFQIKRKIFHILALSIPYIYGFLSKKQMIFFLFASTLLVLLLDVSRRFNKKISQLINKHFYFIMKHKEKKGYLSGASYMFCGFLISATYFDRYLTIVSWYILIISDALSSIIGTICYPKRNKKSFVGFCVFFISAFFISSIYQEVLLTNYFILLLCSVFTALCEYNAKLIKIDDNLLIPLAYCCSIYFFR